MATMGEHESILGGMGVLAVVEFSGLCMLTEGLKSLLSASKGKGGPQPQTAQRSLGLRTAHVAICGTELGSSEFNCLLLYLSWVTLWERGH